MRVPVEGVDYIYTQPSDYTMSLTPTDAAIFGEAFWLGVQGAYEVDGREFYIDEDES